MDKARIDVLVFDGCPNCDVTLERVREAVGRSSVAADVQIVRVEDQEQAQTFRFLGSPTVRVEGTDVEPEAAQRNDYALQCRVYSVDGRLQAAPPVEWIVAALRKTA